MRCQHLCKHLGRYNHTNHIVYSTNADAWSGMMVPLLEDQVPDNGLFLIAIN